MYKAPIELIIADATETLAERAARNLDEQIFSAVMKCGVEVNKEELIRALAYDREQYQQGYEDGVRDCMEAQRWIPVSERLPDAEYEARPEGTNYYAVIAARMTNVHKNTGWTRERVVDKAWYDGEGFVDIVGIDISVGITHWMPLPPAPMDGDT